MAWTWSYRRAIPDASRRPPTEAVTLDALLDTNVVSELIRKKPNPAVEAWVSGYPLENLFFSTVGEAELRFGAAILPTGRSRETLLTDIKRMLCDAFEDRFCRLIARRRVPTRTSPPCAVSPDSMSQRWIARSRRSRDMAVAGEIGSVIASKRQGGVWPSRSSLMSD